MKNGNKNTLKALGLNKKEVAELAGCHWRTVVNYFLDPGALSDDMRLIVGAAIESKLKANAEAERLAKKSFHEIILRDAPHMMEIV